MTVFFALWSMIATAVAIYSVRRNMREYEKLEEIVEQIEESLDVLDECYMNIDAKTKIEVISDDPIVRQVIQDMNRARDSLLLVANKITSPIRESDEVDVG